MTIKELNENKRLEREKQERQRVHDLYKFEDELRKSGFTKIAGVDEAGRGSLAGSLLVAAVILPLDLFIDHLNDSKKLTHMQRDKLYDEITKQAIAYSAVSIEIDEIDDCNIYQATLRGMYRAVEQLPVKPDFVLTDAMKLEFEDGLPTRSIIHGDALSASIAAASIIAKVTRDRMTDEWHKIYPQYGFANNRGYGTKMHIEAIRKYGYCELHRRSFEPVKSMINNK